MLQEQKYKFDINKYRWPINKFRKKEKGKLLIYGKWNKISRISCRKVRSARIVRGFSNVLAYECRFCSARYMIFSPSLVNENSKNANWWSQDGENLWFISLVEMRMRWHVFVFCIFVFQCRKDGCTGRMGVRRK